MVRKLYDYENDLNEWFNLAGTHENKAIIEELEKYIPKENANQFGDLKK
jgi:hypothetical protein